MIHNHTTPFHSSSLLVQTQRDGLDGLMCAPIHNKHVNRRKANQIGMHGYSELIKELRIKIIAYRGQSDTIIRARAHISETVKQRRI